ncbi:Fis family transcriptional regulator [Sphingomonas sp. Root710]|uniref:sigma-54-dependent Fis family transcriptional regulator n=1 Tax=Sphingomonas sp. Root710 TaxID=1736594 RepID=UPI0006F73D49|nr:sigma-54-dependent Fis family transcriptional regulator [Sphingomonas sp. Root710]KRB83908.1 Fis family transcriptional regulator [Sphingomonas sp. Root710]
MAITGTADVSARIDLGARLHFENGMVWLDEHRMLLLHARALGALRSELIKSLGVERASSLLMRMGHDSGAQDAQLARKLAGDGSFEDVFLLGVRFHSLEGMVKVETVSSELDLDHGVFHGEFRWLDSWEAETHIATFGIGDTCTCWHQLGYAAGYASTFMGRRVVLRETMCRSKGDAYCYIVADTAECLSDDDPYIRAFAPDDIAGQLSDMAKEIDELRASLRCDVQTSSLIGRSPKFLRALNLLRQAAVSPITVLLTGETGVGKEVFARWLHDNGPRRDKPFIAVNCGAIPQDLIESELFGVELGAYTGAHRARQGRFERANGGTLFLDEIGDMPLAAQVKLLRVLQSGEIERLGGDKVLKIDVRLVAATNIDLAAAIGEKQFRSDLFYRLNPYPIVIPPLRERIDDIPLFIEVLLARLSKRHSKAIRGVSDRALKMLMGYEWPGNIRELENVLERGVLLTQAGGLIDADSLSVGLAHRERLGAFLGPDGHLHHSNQTAEVSADMAGMTSLNIAQHENRLVSEAMRRANGNINEAADLLGLSRRQLDYRLKAGSSV